MVIFGCDVDGVLSYDKKSGEPDVLQKITPSTYKDMKKLLRRPEKFDVTGGMKGKVEEAVKLAEIGIESAVINLSETENLTKLIRGIDINCTRIMPNE
jgi:isopentenyl phosphate kinase